MKGSTFALAPTAAPLLAVAWLAWFLALAAATIHSRPRLPARHAPERAAEAPRMIRRRRRAEDIVESIPDVVDLFAVASAAGLNPRLAVAAVAERGPPGAITEALVEVCPHVEARGARLADPRDRVPHHVKGDAVRPQVPAHNDPQR
jgi:hypothetical protein